MLDVANNTNLYGFTIEGDFGNAIYGKNVDHVNISGDHDRRHGRRPHRHRTSQHTVSGEEIATIQNVSISNVTGDGIYIHSNITDGGTSTENFKLNGLTISNVGNNGIYIDNFAGNGSKVTSSLTLSNVTVTNAGYDGIGVYALAGGAGSTINQSVAISNTTITNAAYTGIAVQALSYGGASINQNTNLSNVTVNAAVGGQYDDISVGALAFTGGQTTSNVTITNATATGGYNGIDVFAESFGTGASVNQTVNISGATVTDTGADGITLLAEAAGGGSVVQSAMLKSLTISDVGGAHSYYTNGLEINASAAGAGSYASQSATITDANISYVTGGVLNAAFYVGAHAFSGGAVVQSATIDPSSGTHSGFGLSVVAGAYDYGHGQTTIDQHVTVTGTAANPTNFSYNADGGVVVEAVAGSGQGGYASQAAISQSVSISNAVIDHNFDGVVALAAADNGASATQNLSLSNVDISHNTRYGVWIEAYAETLGFVAQNISITGSATFLSQISHNGSDGVFIKDEATYGGLIQQNISVYFTNIDDNGGDGVRIDNYAGGFLNPAPGTYFYSHISQNLAFEYGSISSNVGNGVEIRNTVNYGAQIDQLVYLYGEKVDHNSGYGFIESSIVTTYNGSGFSLPTNLNSDVYIYNSDVSNNAANGIEINSTLQSPTYPAFTIGYSYLIQHVSVGNATVNGNSGSGFAARAIDSGVYGDDIQYITLANSTLNHNGVDGAYFSAIQHYGPGSFGAAIQEVTISGSTFSHNARDGLYAYADAYGQQGRAEQHFTISNSTFDNDGRNGATFEAHAHDGVYLTGFGCGQVQGLDGGCAFVRQTVSITGSDFSHNTSDGIYAYAHANNYGAVYNDSGRPNYTTTMLIEGSTLDHNGGDGLHIKTYATNDSYIYSYAAAVNSHFDHNALNGIEVTSSAYSGSAIVQKTVLYGIGGAAYSTADHNSGGGVFVDSSVKGGAITQQIAVIGSDVSYNGTNGISVAANATNPSGASTPGYVVDPTVSALSQYLYVAGSNVSGNAGYGISVRARATGNKSAISQNLSVVYSSVSGNGNDGVHAFAIAYSGASANQYAYFSSDTIEDNTGDGVYVVGISVNQSSVNQTVNFGYKSGFTTYITGNQGDGIYLGAAAFSGSNVVQTDFVYDVNASSNQRNGLALGSGANGYGFGAAYIYYSHVSQNLVAAYDTFDHNGRNGISVSNVSYYGGAQNQLLEFVGVDASHNAGAGFYETTHLTSIRGNSFSFSTNITTDLYLINSTFNDNGSHGIAIKAYNNGPVYAPAFFGGYSYLIQHTNIAGVTADGNTGSGLLLDAQQRGRYGLDAQYVTIAGSEFNHNTAGGARFDLEVVLRPGGLRRHLREHPDRNEPLLLQWRQRPGIRRQRIGTGRAAPNSM